MVIHMIPKQAFGRAVHVVANCYQMIGMRMFESLCQLERIMMLKWLAKPDPLGKFLGYAFTDLLNHNVEIQFLAREYVMADGCPTSGYFDADAPALVVAIGKPKEAWIKVFVHEYCHFVQRKESIGDPQALWNLCGKREDVFWEWLAGENQTARPRTIQRALWLVRSLELDCEKQTVRLLRKFKLYDDLGIKDYIQSANAYLWFHTYLLSHRQWFDPGKPPYIIPEIKTLMPTNFNQDYNIMPKGYEDLVTKHCYG